MNLRGHPSCVLLGYSTLFGVMHLSQPTTPYHSWSYLIMIIPINFTSHDPELVEPAWCLFWDIQWCCPNIWYHFDSTSDFTPCWIRSAGTQDTALYVGITITLPGVWCMLSLPQTPSNRYSTPSWWFQHNFATTGMFHWYGFTLFTIPSTTYC